MKGCTLIILGFVGTLNAAPWTDRQGSLLTTGIGLSPIYIEEITVSNSLIGGATVMPVQFNVRYGTHVQPTLAVVASAELIGYTDRADNVYVSSLLGIGTQLLLDDFFATRLHASAGYADKRIFGTGMSAGGWGFSLGFTQPITPSLGVEAGYAYRSFSTVASTFAAGDAEYSSALTLGLSYRWL